MNILSESNDFSKTEDIYETSADDQSTENILERICELEKQNKELLQRVDRNTFVTAFISGLSAASAIVYVLLILFQK